MATAQCCLPSKADILTQVCSKQVLQQQEGRDRNAPQQLQTFLPLEAGARRITQAEIGELHNLPWDIYADPLLSFFTEPTFRLLGFRSPSILPSAGHMVFGRFHGGPVQS